MSTNSAMESGTGTVSMGLTQGCVIVKLRKNFATVRETLAHRLKFEQYKHRCTRENGEGGATFRFNGKGPHLFGLSIIGIIGGICYY